MNVDAFLHSNLGFITNIRGSQLIIILLVIFILFGTRRLPELAKGFGKAIREFRKSAFEIEKDFRTAVEETPSPSVQPSQPETANTTKESVSQKLS